MDANTRTLQIGYRLEENKEEAEMVEWTCDICGEKYIDGVSGDADERMCYVCMEQLDQKKEERCKKN